MVYSRGSRIGDGVVRVHDKAGDSKALSARLCSLHGFVFLEFIAQYRCMLWIVTPHRVSGNYPCGYILRFYNGGNREHRFGSSFWLVCTWTSPKFARIFFLHRDTVHPQALQLLVESCLDHISDACTFLILNNSSCIPAIADSPILSDATMKSHRCLSNTLHLHRRRQSHARSGYVICDNCYCDCDG